MPRRETRIEFSSEGLLLEGRWIPPGPQGEAAVLCHPHPLFGGTMDNNVVTALAEALAEKGFGVLRFNFRGVGLSRGGYDFMRGEREDVNAALAWVSTRPEVKPEKLFLAGYSFGGLMALYAVAGGARPRALALISPMPPDKGFEHDPGLQALANLRLPVWVGAGSRDPFCPAPALKPLCRLLSCRVQIFPEVDHFWWGMEDELAESVAGFFSGAGRAAK